MEAKGREGQREYLGQRTVPDSNLEAMAEEIHGHGLPHDAQSQEPNFHLSNLLPSLLEGRGWAGE